MGKHTPLITKALFEQAQQKLRSERALNYDSKEFAFTKLMRCKFCGSGITAQEKFKKLKSGGVAKYVYYGCTRSKDLHCKSGYSGDESGGDGVCSDGLRGQEALQPRVDLFGRRELVERVQPQAIVAGDFDTK